MRPDSTDPPSAIEAVAAQLRGARRVAVLTGAGVSAESGLRTFRGDTDADLPADMRALWKEFDPQSLATPAAFEANPGAVSRWYDWRRLGCLAAEPNPGHAALAEVERRVEAAGGTFVLLTQNVDRLHQRAGSRRVVELHGSILEWRCTKTGTRVTPGAGPLPEYPPRSPHAPGALLRPDVVWFGESLPERAVIEATAAAETCDVFLSVGTSAVVYPAAGFIRAAAEHGAYTAEINLEPTPLSEWVDVSVRGRTSELLPALVRAAWPGG
jgi:NAD-dependent deacetylase